MILKRIKVAYVVALAGTSPMIRRCIRRQFLPVFFASTHTRDTRFRRHRCRCQRGFRLVRPCRRHTGLACGVAFFVCAGREKTSVSESLGYAKCKSTRF